MAARKKIGGQSAQGFILPITLFILTIIALLITGMLTSVSLDQRLAANRLLRLQSRALAESGLEAGLQLVRSEMTQTPSHAVGYVPEHDDLIASLDLPADSVRPVLLAADLESGDSREIPLRSTASKSDPAQWVDLNEDLVHGMKFDSIPKMPAAWVEMPVQPGSTADRAGYRLRYAFYVDDESSRLNYAVAGNADGPQGGFVRGERGGPRNLHVGALPWFGEEGWSDRAEGEAINRDFIEFRNRYPLSEPAFPNRFPRLSSPPYPLMVGYSGTTFSSSNQLTSTGHRRANLGSIFNEVDAVDATSIEEALQEFRRIVNSRLPGFSERFQPEQMAAGEEADFLKRRYLDTLGVNLIDQLDTDSSPTWLGTENTGLTFPLNDREEGVYAVGQEAIPLLLGHAWWFRLQPKEVKAGTMPFDGTVDHFFEFLNMSTKDFSAPEGMVLKIRDRPDLEGGAGAHELPDLTIPLEGVVFPAGKVTIISTAKLPPADSARFIAEEAKLQYIEVAEEARQISGEMELEESERQKESSPQYRLGVARDGALRDRDFHTFVEWGAGNQLWGYFPLLDLQNQEEGKSSTLEFVWEKDQLEPISRFFASRLDGSFPPRLTGDPRGLLSQLEFSVPPVSGPDEEASERHTPFTPVSLISQTGNKAGSMALGDLLNDFWRRDQWPDDSQPFDGEAQSAASVILDRLPRHIGELRFVHDPRYSTSRDLEHERTGGRSLRIGRPESLDSERRFSPGWRRASWRLADAFGVQLQDRRYLPPQSSGEININGVLRDDGAALRAALRDWRFQSDSQTAGQLPGHVLSDAEENALIESVREFIRVHGLYLERGEISETPLEMLPGTMPPDQVNDRTREELLANLIPFLTTRSLSFRISAVAQVYRPLPNGGIEVKAESSMVAIFGLRPVFGEGEDAPVISYDTACLYQFPAD